jgi:murein DD-endopeptidase MepM/ murein hydrolase activator NlpD
MSKKKLAGITGACVIAMVVVVFIARPSLVPTPTPTPLLFAVTSSAFFDYNGNGIQDSGEPPLEGITLTYDPGNFTCVTSTDGKAVVNIPAGNYSLHVADSSKEFRYILPSVSEIRRIGDGLSENITGNATVAVPLAEGFLTLPFNEETTFSIKNFVDLSNVFDPNDQNIRDWKGTSQTYKGHQGIDYVGSYLTEVVAAAPGIIIGCESDWTTNSDLSEIGNRVVIYHPDSGYFTAYNHLDSTADDIPQIKFDPEYVYDPSTIPEDFPRVARGQIIGYMGKTGQTPFVHLHFESWPRTYRYFGGGKGWVIDPYRDLFYGQHGEALFSNKESLWTVDNGPRYP